MPGSTDQAEKTTEQRRRVSRRLAYVSTWDQTREGESWGREAPAKSGKSGCAFAGPVVGRLGFTQGGRGGGTGSFK